jgi:hypothetical protein
VNDARHATNCRCSDPWSARDAGRWIVIGTRSLFIGRRVFVADRAVGGPIELSATRRELSAVRIELSAIRNELEWTETVDRAPGARRNGSIFTRRERSARVTEGEVMSPIAFMPQTD